MNYLFLTGILFYIAGIFIERQIDSKGTAMLSGEQIELLKNNFIKLRKRNSMANLILAMVYLIAIFTLSIGVFVLIIGYVVCYLSIFL